MSEENKAIIRRFWEEAWNKGNLKAIDELYAPDHVLRAEWQNPALGGAITESGMEVARRVTKMWRSAVPDFHVVIDRQIAEGDKVMTQHTSTGTNLGKFLGIFPPTGKAGTVTGMTINRLRAGKIVETWTQWDALGALQAFGIIPRMPPPVTHAPGAAPPSDPEANKALVRRLYEEVWNEGKVDAVDELFSPTTTFLSPFYPMPAVGAQPLKMFVAFLRGALPDLKFEVQNMMAEGEWVTARWMCLPTHTRPFLGVEPTGNTLYFTALEMFRISGGKIQQIWLEMNLLNVLNQLGIAAPLNLGMPGPPGH
jgi:steroid delta-isomerase-like uncharacterized protein